MKRDNGDCSQSREPAVFLGGAMKEFLKEGLWPMLAGFFATAGIVAIGVMGAFWFLPNASVHAQSSLPGPPWTCSLDNIGATLTKCKDKAADGQRLYITDITITSTTATAGLFLLRTGTGTDCGTATLSLFPSLATVPRFGYPGNASAPTTIRFVTPLKPPAETDLCLIGSATNTATFQISGYVGP